MALDDRELARRFPSGDDDVVRAAYERYGGAVHTVAMSILRDAERAADAVQATFLNAWRRAATFDPDRALGPWLYAIARRQAIDIYRRERRLTPLPPDEVEGVAELHSFEHEWEVWQVRLALDQLSADEREVVRLTWFEGLSHAEVATRLGVPAGTVKSRSHRAHRRLAVLLGHLHGENRSPATDVETTEAPP